MTNSYKKKVSAGILIIGNEILSGRTQDLNISFLCDWLNKKCGITVEEVRVVPDIEQRIVKNVTELKKKFKYKNLFDSIEKIIIFFVLNQLADLTIHIL